MFGKKFALAKSLIERRKNPIKLQGHNEEEEGILAHKRYSEDAMYEKPDMF